MIRLVLKHTLQFVKGDDFRYNCRMGTELAESGAEGPKKKKRVKRIPPPPEDNEETWARIIGSNPDYVNPSNIAIPKPDSSTPDAPGKDEKTHQEELWEKP